MKQSNDSRAKTHPGEASNTWDLKGVTLFRALGYVVGLPSFIVGTAVFMLGFALMDADWHFVLRNTTLPTDGAWFQDVHLMRHH